MILKASKKFQMQKKKKKKMPIQTHLILMGSIWVSQKYCIILVRWGTIQQLQVILQTSLRGQITRDCEMLSLPKTLRLLLARIASMTRNMASELTYLGWIDKVLVTRAKFLQPSVYCTVITVPSHKYFSCLQLLPQCYHS